MQCSGQGEKLDLEWPKSYKDIHGAVLALTALLQDGAELALELARQGRGYRGRVKDFEAGMFRRALEPAKMSAENMDMCISQDGSHRLADMMRSFHDQPNHA